MNIALLGLATLAVGSGCGRKAQPAQPTASTDQAPVSQPNRPPDTAPADRTANDAAEAARRAARERARQTLEEMVFFDYDVATLTAEAKRILQSKVSLLREYPSVRLRIEGHADERGSVEYNLALGLRRANSMLGFLTDYGIPASRLEVISFGEERPVAIGTSEAEYARNRRAEFHILGVFVE